MNTLKQTFEESAKSAFSFLVEDFRFRLEQVVPNKLRFESDRTYVEVVYGDYDFEISIAFGRLNGHAPTERFDFTLFLRLVNPKMDSALGERLADRPEKIHEVVNGLASALHSEGLEIIEGDDQVFERMKTVTWWQFQPEALRTNDPASQPIDCKCSSPGKASPPHLKGSYSKHLRA